MGHYIDNMALNTDEAKTTLSGFFKRIDRLVDEDKSASKDELTKVFGEHAGEFLKFCDKDDDKALTEEEFVEGIINDCKDMKQDDFDTNWKTRMEDVITKAEEEKAKANPPPSSDDAAKAEAAADKAKEDEAAKAAKDAEKTN